MTDVDAIDSVVAQYSKFGWKLERILLSKVDIDLRAGLSSKYPEAQVLERPLGALWFSRPRSNSVTWEIRRITGSPFALLAVFDSEASEEERENILRDLEEQIAKTAADIGGEIPLEK
jgi:hypothetical protein